MKISKLTPPLLLIATLVLSGTARADVTFYDVFLNNEYLQISNAQPSTAAGFFATATLSYSTAGDVANAQVATGGTPSPDTLTSTPGNNFNYEASFATLAGMNTAFPLGNPYTFQISGGTLGTQSALLNTPATALDSAIPFLTGSSYSNLQGLNPTSADTIGINGFSFKLVGATDSVVFLTVTRQSDNAVVFQQSFLAASTTSVLLAANTLAANTAYNVDLDYSSRVSTADAGFGTGTSILAFEQRTEVSFTTGSVPEPSSLALTLMGAAMGLAVMVQRRRSKRSA